MASNHHLTPTIDCDQLRELIPDYAFGLTQPEETRLVEANLAHCPEAATELADYRKIQDDLRLAVPQIEPPSDLEERLMAAISIPADIVVTAPARLVAPQEATKPLQQLVASAVPNKKQRRFPMMRLWQAASLAAVLALIVSNLYWALRVDTLNHQKDNLAAQLVNNGSSTGTNAFVLNSTSGLRWVRLPSSQKNGEASAFLMWNAESEIGLLYARGFPQLIVGKTYQLWLTRGEERVGVGTFRVDEEGKGALLFHSSEPIDKFTWARITAEPVSGSEKPSETIVVIGKLST